MIGSQLAGCVHAYLSRHTPADPKMFVPAIIAEATGSYANTEEAPANLKEITPSAYHKICCESYAMVQTCLTSLLGGLV